MPGRLAESYRAARRNLCLREFKTTWGGAFYADNFKPNVMRRTILSRKYRKA